MGGGVVAAVIFAGVLLFGHGSSDDEMQASSVIIMPDLSHMTIEEAQNFCPPDYFGEDVTFSPDYHNSTLSQK